MGERPRKSTGVGAEDLSKASKLANGVETEKMQGSGALCTPFRNYFLILNEIAGGEWPLRYILAVRNKIVIIRPIY